jgi:hypothetical protein
MGQREKPWILVRGHSVSNVAACTLLVAVVMAGGSLPARASSLDAASARRFLADATTYLRSSEAHRKQIKAAVLRLIEHLESSCPGSLAHAPPPIIEHAAGMPPWHGGGEGTPAQEATSRSFLTLVLGELKLAAYDPIRSAAIRFSNDLIHLRWATPLIAHTLADVAHSILAELALSSPDLCADAGESATSGFTVVPADVARFVERYQAAMLPHSRRNLLELAKLVRPALTVRDLGLFARFRRLWLRQEPRLQISDATTFRLLAAVFGSPGRRATP